MSKLIQAFEQHESRYLAICREHGLNAYTGEPLRRWLKSWQLSLEQDLSLREAFEAIHPKAVAQSVAFHYDYRKYELWDTHVKAWNWARENQPVAAAR